MVLTRHHTNKRLTEFLNKCSKLRRERSEYLESTVSKILNADFTTKNEDLTLPFLFSDKPEELYGDESNYIYGKFDIYAYCLKETLNIYGSNYQIDMDSLSSTIELSVKLLKSDNPQFELLNKSLYRNSSKVIRFIRERTNPLPGELFGLFVYSLFFILLLMALITVIYLPSDLIDKKPLIISLLSFLIIAVIWKAIAPALVKIFPSNKKSSVNIDIDNPEFYKNYLVFSKEDSIDNEFKIKYVLDDDVVNRILNSDYQISKIDCHDGYLNIIIKTDLLDDKNCLNILEELIDITKYFDEIEY